MPTNDIDPVTVGPSIDPANIDIPADVGRGMARLYGLDEPPVTAADWLDATRMALAGSIDGRATLEDLCTTDDGDHAFESASGDFRQEYVCVLDPIAYPYVANVPGTITTVTAVRETPITIDVDENDFEANGAKANGVDENGVDTDHPDALISIGVSEHADGADRVTPETIYRQVCGYVQTFEDESAYEQWATTVDAVTTAVPLTTGIGLAGAIATELFE